jgi:hypothetical protein
MSYFSGSQAVNLDETVLGVLKTYLKTQLALAPHSATFARWGGPGVSIDPDSDFAPGARGSGELYSKKPWVYLEVVSRETVRWGKTVGDVFYDGTRHSIEISAEVLTSDACLPAERPLKDALVSIVRSGYHALWDLKLEETEIRAGQSSSDSRNRLNPHTINLIAYTLQI